MKAIWILFFCSGLTFANDLLTDMNQELTQTGQTRFSDIQIALIASGIDSQTKLDTMTEKYEGIMAKLGLNEKQAKAKPKRKARTLHRKLFSWLKKENADGTGVIATIDDGVYNHLSSTFFYMDLCQRNDVSAVDAGTIQDRVNPYFFTESGSLREVTASILTQMAIRTHAENAQRANTMLLTSKKLWPKESYGAGVFDVQLYNGTLNLYNSNRLKEAAYIAAGACERYPSLKEFSGLAYNIGVKMFMNTDTSKNYDEALEVGPMLTAYTGEYQGDYKKTLSTVAYNYAVKLYNDKKFRKALDQLTNVSPDQQGFNTLQTNSYIQIIEAAIAAEDNDTIRTTLAELETVDPDQAQKTRTRLSQLKLQALDASGDYEEALKLASEDLGSDIGKNNYLSVLTRYIQAKRNEDPEGALEFLNLDNLPEVVREKEEIRNLRFNSYINWLNRYTDEEYKKVKPIYARILADKVLNLSNEDRGNMIEGYGNALYHEITDLIAERDFKKADAESKKALELAPNHKLLKKQRDLVDTILKRIGN